MGRIDWLDTPLSDFPLSDLFGAKKWDHAAERIMVGLSLDVEDTYANFVSEEDYERLESLGEVPVIRAGKRTYERLDALTLRDLPVMLDTLLVLEEEAKVRAHGEDERRAAERRARKRARDKERRKRKKLGEW